MLPIFTKFLFPKYTKTNETMGKFSVKKINRIQLIKHKTNLVQKDGGEERQEEYPTSVPLIPSSVWNRCRGTLLISLLHHLSVLG